MNCGVHDFGNMQGPVESVSVGEIKVSLRKSLVKLGAAFISRDPKLQVVINDLEIVLRPSVKGTEKPKPQKPKATKKRSPGKGKWMVVVNLARFLSVSITDLVLKVMIYLIKSFWFACKLWCHLS